MAMYITLFSIVYIDQHQMNVRFFEVHGDPILDGWICTIHSIHTQSVFTPVCDHNQT
jgi:hypothetical protein